MKHKAVNNADTLSDTLNDYLNVFILINFIEEHKTPKP